MTTHISKIDRVASYLQNMMRDPDFTWEDAEMQNRTGWTVEVAVGANNTIWRQIDPLSAADLQEAYRRAEQPGGGA